MTAATQLPLVVVCSGSQHWAVMSLKHNTEPTRHDAMQAQCVLTNGRVVAVEPTCMRAGGGQHRLAGWLLPTRHRLAGNSEGAELMMYFCNAGRRARLDLQVA